MVISGLKGLMLSVDLMSVGRNSIVMQMLKQKLIFFPIL